MEQYDALLAAAQRGDLDAVIRYFELPDVRANVAAWNAEHSTQRLEERPLNETLVRPWYHDPHRDDFLFKLMIYRGHVDVFRWFFRRDQLETMGETLRAIAIHIARAFADAGHPSAEELVEIFVESPLFTDIMTNEEQRTVLGTLLNIAVSNWPGWVDALLAYGADPNFKCGGKTPFTAITYEGRVETLDVLLANGAWLEGDDLLAHRCNEYCGNIVGALVQRGADANAVVTEHSALHDAVYRLFLSNVSSLIRDGFADVDRRDRHGRTPLMLLADDNERPRVHSRRSRHIQILLGRKLITLLRRKVLDMLVDTGADLDAVDDEGECALHHAVHHASSDFLGLLLERGANPNVQDRKGWTPLHTLLRQRPYGVFPTRVHLRNGIDLLLKAGADAFVVDSQGISAVDLLESLGSAYVQSFPALSRIRHVPGG